MWFHDYAARFFALPHEQQLQCPGPCSEVFKEKWCDYSRYGASLTSVNASGRRYDATLVGTPDDATKAPGIEKTRPNPLPRQQTLSSASEPGRRDQCRILLQSLRSFSSLRSGRPTVVESDFLLANDSDSLGGSCGPGCPCKQPFRDECMHVVKTFLKPGSHKQLNVEPELILDTIKQLAESTHPVVVRIDILLVDMRLISAVVRQAVRSGVRRARAGTSTSIHDDGYDECDTEAAAQLVRTSCFVRNTSNHLIAL